MSEFREGDRVRVTRSIDGFEFEGTVTLAHSNGTYRVTVPVGDSFGDWFAGPERMRHVSGVASAAPDGQKSE